MHIAKIVILNFDVQVYNYHEHNLLSLAIGHRLFDTVCKIKVAKSCKDHNLSYIG